MVKLFSLFKKDLNENKQHFEFEYEDKYSNGHKCKCSGDFDSLQDAIAFFGFETDDSIIYWKEITHKS